jgi:hypothetical protein
MKLLVDTDVFCKLGIANSLEDSARIFGAKLQECGRLPALPFMLRRGRLRKLFGDSSCDALIPVADSMPEVPQPSVTWLEKLTAIEAIDPGEVLIFARAGESGLPFWTSDKRALRALKAIEDFIPALAGHVVVLEAIMLALCDRLGHEEMRQRIAPLAVVDRMVEVCFSSGNPDPSTALLSYYRALEIELAPFELWNPRGRG